MLSGSSKETSERFLLFLRKCIKISFSIQRDAYVANFIFFSGLNVFTALISPIVPMLIKSSIFIPVFSNFLAIYTTSRKLRSISNDLAA